MARNGNGAIAHRINIKTNHRTAGFFNVPKEVAELWLTEDYNPYNRNFRKALGEKYSRDRVNDQWITTHQGISFDWNGHMVDGQHRAFMIANTGLTTEMLVVTGLDPRARMVVDIGAPRRPADILKLIGRKGVTASNVAIVRSMMNGTNRRATIPEIVVAWDAYSDAARTATSFFPTLLKRIVISPVLGPLAVASYTQDVSQLQDFADVLYSGRSNGKKGCAGILLLRDYLTSLPSRADSISKHIYGLTETALAAYLANEKLTVLEPAREELFTIPKKVNKPKPPQKETPFKMRNTVLVREEARV